MIWDWIMLIYLKLVKIKASQNNLQLIICISVIPILYEDASNYMSNEPQRAHTPTEKQATRSVSSEKDTKKE